MSDKDPETAKMYALRQLEYIEGERKKQRKERIGDDGSQKIPAERNLNLDDCIRVLGGRMKDLDGLAQRLALGVSPDGLDFLCPHANYT